MRLIQIVFLMGLLLLAACSTLSEGFNCQADYQRTGVCMERMCHFEICSCDDCPEGADCDCKCCVRD